MNTRGSGRRHVVGPLGYSVVHGWGMEQVEALEARGLAAVALEQEEGWDERATIPDFVAGGAAH